MDTEVLSTGQGNYDKTSFGEHQRISLRISFPKLSRKLLLWFNPATKHLHMGGGRKFEWRRKIKLMGWYKDSLIGQKKGGGVINN